jgi:CelD/BcsL family acetyltransferase involved in cellulose biosynthesis
VKTAEQTRVRLPAESFFLSAHWLAACERTWPEASRFERLSLSDGARELGFVLIGRGVETRHRVLRSRIAAINESANPALDEATIELNGVFDCPQGAFAEAFETLVRRLSADLTWDELRFSGVLGDRGREAQRIAARHGLRSRVFRERTTYWVDLDSIRTCHGGDFAASLSSNTRQQLRRARRALERDVGPLALTAACSAEQALEWIDALAPFHRRRWSGGLQPSGFDNPLFVAFHRALVQGAFEHGVIEVLCLEAGSRAIAYLYNFRLDGHAYFYLSGIDYEHAEQYRPGMLAHWMAIERYVSMGDRIYDFLAGDNTYKARLCTDQAIQQDWIFWRPSVALRIEDLLRRLRREVRARWPSGSATRR